MSAEVTIYTTRVCPYCIAAKRLLGERKIAYKEINVDGDDAKRAWLVESTGRRTVPQIFIGDTWVGGCDDLYALDQRGGLLPLLGA